MMDVKTVPSATRTTLIPVPGRGFVVAVTLAAALVALAAGGWLLVAPGSFAEFVRFLPEHTHFQRDAGAFQLGIGATLLLALIWQDGLALVLAGFLVGNTVHMVNHIVDLDHGGRATDPWLLAVLSLLAGAALGVRLRQLGYIVGEVATATIPALAPFVRQKTILITTYRADGRPGRTPVSIAVDGDRAYVRCPGTSLKARRLRRNPVVEICPSTGNPKNARPTGPAIRARARLLSGAEHRHAGRLLGRKYPFLQGLLVPLLHRTNRRKIGKTLHFELTPLDDRPGEPAAAQ